MQNDRYGCYEECEPRSTPQQASTFDNRPSPMVPEVSLILENSQKLKKMNDTAVPELKLSNFHDTARGSESYAAWKEKQFPQQSIKATPNRYHQLLSNTANSNILQGTHDSKKSPKSCNAVDCKDYRCSNQSSANEPSRRYSDIQRLEHNESPYKYGIQHTESHNKNSQERRNSHSYRRSHSDENGYDERDIHNYRRSHSSENDHDLKHTHNYKRSQTFRNHEESICDDKREFDYSRAIEPYDSRQKPRHHRSSSCTNLDSHTHRDIPDEQHHLRHSRSLPPPAHYNTDRQHKHSRHYSSNNNSSSTEAETVKNLLQVISSQNEQIKNLQKQVERLLKLHEQSLKDRNICTCQASGMSSGIVYQNAQMYDQSRTTNLPVVHNQLIAENERRFTDLKIQDDKNKQTIVEQKVSIGVMTSFELKVQNNPTLIKENETRHKNNQEKMLQNIGTTNIIKNLVNDTEEMIRKKPNFFTPTALENISEGSESRLSSLRQSHVCSDSRQSIEAHDSVEVQTNYYTHDNQNVQMNSEFKQLVNNSDDNDNVRYRNVYNYENQESLYERPNSEQKRLTFEYNLDFDNEQCSPHENYNGRNVEDINAQPLTSDIPKMKNTRSDNIADDCLSLSSSELDLEELSPPSPEPSIHLDMQEYNSEDGSIAPQPATKVGWTLYNNVVDQVNQILQNSPVRDKSDDESSDSRRRNERNDYENNIIMDTVKAATLEQLTKFGISISNNEDQREPNSNKKVLFDPSYYSKPLPDAHITATSTSIETNTSMHMKALAKKYLNEDQLAEMAMQKPRPGALKQASSNMFNTNMSFATLHYLQRYQLLPGGNTTPIKETVREEYRAVATEKPAIRNAERRAPSPHKYPAYTGMTKVSCPNKILDITTLKQQPKLL